MAIEVFNRVEKKFVLNNDQYESIKPVISNMMAYDEHSKETSYLIQNIYYDTDDQFLIKHSLSSPAFKEKLRIRAYGKVNFESYVYIELKKKINGVVNKRRSTIKLSEAYKFIHTKELPDFQDYHNRLVLKEIQQFLYRYNLKPSTYISYERYAFKKDEFRVTLDQNIMTRNYDLRLEYGPYGEELLEKKHYLLEAKSNLGLPLWFTELLSKSKLYKTSFSKYGKDYLRRTRAFEEKGVRGCLKQSLTIHQKQQLHL